MFLDKCEVKEKMIDKLVFVILSVTGSFCCAFRVLNGSIVFSMIFSFLISMGALFLFTRLKLRSQKRSKKVRASYANTVLDAWMLLNDEEAQENLMRLLKNHKTVIDQVEISICPTTSKALNADWIFEIWKKHRGTERVIAATTGFADQSAKQMCLQLNCPQIEFIDRKRLIDWIITDTPWVNDEWLLKNQAKENVCMKFEHILGTVNPWRCSIYAALTLIFYLFFGKNVDLLLSLCLFIIAALTFYRKKHLRRE